MVSTEIQRARKAAVDEGAATGGRQPAVGSGNSPVHLLAVPGKLASAAPRAATWRGSLIVFAVASAALAWLFRAEIVAAVRVWQSSATFGHAFFITPIVIFLFYRKRHELALLAPAPAPWAIVPMAALALVWMVGEVANVLVVKQLAVVGLWQALFLLVMGWRVTRAALFPLLYLYFAVPAGSSAIPALQEVTAEMVVHLLRLTGMPVFLDGYLIQIPSGRFLVAEACSGVRYLIVSIALGVLVAHLFMRSWPRRLLFIGLSVVIPVVANGIRAYGIIMLAHLSDYRIAADVDHVFYGLIFLSIVTLSMLAIAALLREGSGPAEPAPAAPATGDSGERRKPGREILTTQAVWCGAALAAVLLAQAWAASAKEAPAVLEPALLLPEAAAPWRAVSDSAALWQPRFQGPDVVLRGSYRRGTDRVDLHVAYYAYQREGAEAVSELNDLAEVGRPWRVLRLKPAEITVNGRPHRFTRMLLTDRTDTYVVWYWYRVAGENARSRLFAKLLELKALMPGAEKSASVIAIASRVSEDAERTNALLAAFLEQTLDSNGSLGARRRPLDWEVAQMCGLAGIFDSVGRRPIDRALLQAMTDSLVHRGPDGQGFHLAEGIGLGHRRLSIIDLAGGQQPMYNEDDSVAVVYNGEIYNFKELAQELRSRGHRFRSVCDTEVIVHAWEEWGAACVERFRGMFAFALWDSRKETLFLARDRLGIKPLYYALLPDGQLIFGSELKALLCDPHLERSFDIQAIEDYFAFGYVPDPKTIYEAVRKLPPAHVLVWQRGAAAPTLSQYWEIRFEANPRIDEADACVELRERIGEAVKIRLMSDVPLGAFLSGGVDSSSVVSMMAHYSPDSVNTCSIGFDVPEFDEASYAELVARHLKTQHRTRQVSADSFELIESMSSFYDEPFADSSSMPTYQVCRLAREKVTVALSGDGGDEAFAGYRRYRWHHYEELVRGALPGPLRHPVFGLLGQVYPKLDWAPRTLRAKSTLQALARDTVEGYFYSVSILDDRLRRRLYSQRLRRDLQGYHARDVLDRVMRDAPVEHHLDRVQYADMKTYLPGDILTKVDRASMATSLEVRVPLLDHKLLEWAATLPPAFRLRAREGKYLLKKAMEDRLPREILYREKMGFCIPLARWFRGPLRAVVRQRLLNGILAEADLFDMAFIERLLDEHGSGISDHSAAIWALLMFESFLSNVNVRTTTEPVGQRATGT